MTPAARYAAAAGVLDEILSGAVAEQTLTRWGRANRYAGSGDRAAVRDIVYDALRRKRSAASLGGGETGRALVLGLLRAAEVSPQSVFTGERYALAPLDPAETARGEAPTGLAALDIPDWIAGELQRSLGPEFAAVCETLRHRADVFLRWHARRTDAASAIAALRADRIVAEPHPLAPTALVVREGARRIRSSAAYLSGIVEVQDAASQAVGAALPVEGGMRVLDYCAGGGGKALALAAAGARVWAHDIDAGRMVDLPKRAARAQDRIALVPNDGVTGLQPFDLVLVDAPCSGSGAWRRQVEGKWRLTPGMLDTLIETQHDVLQKAARMVRPGGWLAYVTCSLLDRENADQIARFVQDAGRDAPERWQVAQERSFSPLDGADGFFLALLRCVTQP